MSVLKIKIAEAYQPLFEPKRFKVYYGGRGAGKSYTFALCLLLLATKQKIKVLCAREFQASIRDSVHALLKQIISEYKLPFFEITETEIRNNSTGSAFIFKGIKRDIDSIKSMQGITHCWVEEAERVSKSSWDDLIPTIREEGSEIWVSFNPREKANETYQRFVVKQSDNVLAKKVIYKDNPFISKTLLDEMEQAKRVRSIEDFNHIWMGEPLDISDAVIFKDKIVIQEFDTPDVNEIKYNKFLYGADWGFSPDPMAATGSFIIENTLYIFQEAYKVGVQLSDIGKELDKALPEMKKWPSKGDSARPDIISMLVKEGFKISGVSKSITGGHSNKLKYVESGIDYLLNFDKIVIHPRCKHTITEFTLYSYKVDPNSGDVLPIIIDKWNHAIDSIRYGHNDYIKQKTNVYAISI